MYMEPCPVFGLSSAMNSRNTCSIHFLELKDRVETRQYKTWLPRLLTSPSPCPLHLCQIHQSVTKFDRETGWISIY
jgi:hypothetical protein